MSDDANFDDSRSCAVEILAVDEAKITPEAKFGDDLDADSLDLVELVMALEEEFDVERRRRGARRHRDRRPGLRVSIKGKLG